MGGVNTSPSLLPLVRINPERLPSDFTDRLGRPILSNGAFGFGALGPSQIAQSAQHPSTEAAPIPVPKPDDEKTPPRDKGRCLERWLDARAADERLSTVLVAIEVNRTRTEAVKAEVPRLKREISDLMPEFAVGGAGAARALARGARALFVAKAAKGGTQFGQLLQKEAELASVQRTIAELNKEKGKLEGQETARRKDSTAANAKLKACQDEHGDKA